MNKYKRITLDGLIFQNPTLILVLGTCPTLAMLSKSATDALVMGITVLIVLTLSNIIISALRKVIPNAVRIPCYIVIIATLVTLAQMILKKFLPDLYSEIALYIDLVVVNCIILGRAETFASKHTVGESALDGLANGLGFAIAIILMGIICEFFGKGSLFGLHIMDFKIEIFSKPAGAFLVYGLSIAVFTFVIDKIKSAQRIKANKLARENLLKEEA